MFRTHDNKRPVETFLVAKDNQAMANTAEAGNHLNDTATGNPRLNDGQLGILNYDQFSSPLAGQTGFVNFTTTAPAYPADNILTLVQGTNYNWGTQTARWRGPLPPRPYVMSNAIQGQNWVISTKQEYKDPTYSTWVIGDTAGNPNAIVPLDNTEYQLTIAFRGRMMDEFCNNAGSCVFKPNYVTPDYTFLGTPDPMDHLVQHLAWDINRNSTDLNFRPNYGGNLPLVAFAISTAGAGVPIASVTAGMTLPMINTNLGVRSLVLDQGMVDCLQAAVTGVAGQTLPAGAGIVMIDLTTAGTAAGGTVDSLILMAMDRHLAYEDRVPQTKIRLQVGLSRGFDFYNVLHNEVCFANEGQGLPRVLDLQYRATHNQRLYNLDHTADPVIEYPSPINMDTTYTTYVIEHVDVNQIDTTNMSESPLKTIVLIPTDDVVTEAEFEAQFGAWLTSLNNVTRNW